MVAAMQVPVADTSRYGIFRELGDCEGRQVAASGMVEKPNPGTEPSRLAAVGRYILDPSVFTTLERTRVGAGGEMQLTDAINADAERLPLTAFRFSGRRFDCGCLDELLEAGIARQAQQRRREKRATIAPATGGMRQSSGPIEAQQAQA